MVSTISTADLTTVYFTILLNYPMPSNFRRTAVLKRFPDMPIVLSSPLGEDIKLICVRVLKSSTSNHGTHTCGPHIHMCMFPYMCLHRRYLRLNLKLGHMATDNRGTFWTPSQLVESHLRVYCYLQLTQGRLFSGTLAINIYLVKVHIV